MNCYFVILVLFVSVQSAPLSIKSDQNISLLKSEFQRTVNAYNFRYQLSDGQSREEKGYFKKVGNTDVLTIEGSYSFVGDDGVNYKVKYIADDQGYVVDDAIATANLNEIKKSSPSKINSKDSSISDDSDFEFEIDLDQLNGGNEEVSDYEFDPDSFGTEPPVQLSPNIIASLAG